MKHARGQAHRGDDGERGDEARGEPIALLPLSRITRSAPTPSDSNDPDVGTLAVVYGNYPDNDGIFREQALSSRGSARSDAALRPAVDPRQGDCRPIVQVGLMSG